MSSPPHADRVLPEDQSRSLHSSRSLRLRRCLPPPPSRRHPAPLLSRPPSPLPPQGVAVVFGGGRGGVLIVVVIHVRAPHVVKETPGVIIVRMEEDDRPSPIGAALENLLACKRKKKFWFHVRNNQ